MRIAVNSNAKIIARVDPNVIILLSLNRSMDSVVVAQCGRSYESRCCHVFEVDDTHD